ncbi:2-oxo acid dehydrogenase subunit E2, partial [candidate division KSB1 bacterium]|nr:2-oxo acid dehydrogenase subunit E2 [candidate division KSB1 bacterium]
MKVEIILPQMGESVSEGTILKWMKKPGDRVELDEILFEISTDKVDSEIPSPATGIITELKAAEGDTVGIGSVLGYIETEAKQAEVKTPPPKQPVKTEEVKPAAPAPPVPEPVHEVETHQTSVTHAVTPAPEQTPVDTKPLMAPGDGERKYYSPLVLKIAQEEGIPLGALETIKGSGIAGRITKKDILANLQRLKLPPESVTDTSPAATEKKGTGGAFDTVPIQTTFSSDAIKTRPEIAYAADGTSVVPLDNMRQRIAEHMIHSVRTSVHVTSVSEADVTELVHYRDRENEEFLNREGFALNYAAFVTRALVLAVQDFPNLNASLDGTNIIYKKNINVGIAV